MRNRNKYHSKDEEREWPLIGNGRPEKDGLKKSRRKKRRFQPRRDQHLKYSFCPACKSYKDEFGSGYSWIDYKWFSSKNKI